MNSRDQRGTLHTFSTTPQRILSLVPSITELLCDLGLEERLVGCTKFCVHPSGLRKRVSVVGGTKNVRVTDALDLQPDLILASKEENVKEQVEALATAAPAWVSDVQDVATAEQLILELGELFGAQDAAQQILVANRHALSLRTVAPGTRALYLIWQDPFMGVGHDTYIHDVLHRLGYSNVCAGESRYPTLTDSAIGTLAQQADQGPLHILLSSEPFPFQAKHVEALQRAYPLAQVQRVDGEFFSWYGSRLSHLTAKG